MAQANVLVVEDDDSIRRLLIESLRQRAGISVDGARDGRDALHQISTKRYSVVVLDLLMPYMSGVDFLDSLQALQNDPSLRRIDRSPSVIVVTACTSDLVPTNAIQQRFPDLVRDVMRKPVDVDALASRVSMLL